MTLLNFNRNNSVLLCQLSHFITSILAWSQNCFLRSRTNRFLCSKNSHFQLWQSDFGLWLHPLISLHVFVPSLAHSISWFKSGRTMVFAFEVTKIHTLIFQGLLFSSHTQMSDCQLYVLERIPRNSGTLKYVTPASLCVLYNFYSHDKK